MGVVLRKLQTDQEITEAFNAGEQILFREMGDIVYEPAKGFTLEDLIDATTHGFELAVKMADDKVS